MEIPDSLRKLMQKDHETRAFVSHILKENKELKKRIDQLEEKNNHLEEQVKEIKSYIWKPKRQTTEPKKLGPPKGHKPHNRPVPEKIHRKLKLSLDKCPDCGSELSKATMVRKRYVEDIRPPEPMSTEYEIPYYWCKNCKKQVSPKPADVIPKCRFGIKLMLLVTFLRYGLLLPFNKIAKELDMIYGISISEGCLVDSITRFADYMGPEFEQIKHEVKQMAVVYKDWTGWRINGKNVWLWDFIGDRAALILIRRSRGKKVIREVLGKDYGGISVSDCMPTARHLEWKQQKCWVHLLRYTRNIGSAEGKLLHARLKHIHELAKSGRFGVDYLLDKIDRLKSIGLTEKKCITMLKRLDKYRDSLFTFVEHPEVSDNNNEAERGLRQSVVMRKITGGNRSDKGARNHEIIMTVMQTWEKQGLDFFEQGLDIIQDNLP
jgi:transposase